MPDAPKPPAAKPTSGASAISKPGLTDAETSARSTKHAAWVAAAAAIMAAVLALGGALWSGYVSARASDRAAAIAADAAVKAVSVQVERETEKSQAEFLRAQRQELYGSIMTDEKALVKAEVDFHGKAGTKAGSHKLLQKNSGVLNDAYSKFADHASTMEVIGSETAISSFMELAQEHGELADALNTFYVYAANPQFKGNLIELEEEVDAHYDQVDDSQVKFRAAVRTDMGAR